MAKDNIEDWLDHELGLDDPESKINTNVFEPKPDPSEFESRDEKIVINVSQNIVKDEKGNVKCDNCGSSNVKMLSREMAICEYCGTKVKIKRPNQDQNIKVTVKSGNANIDSQYFVMKTNFGEEEFKRNTAYLLSTLRDTPLDIMDSKFDDVITNYPQFMVMWVHIEGNYSASVGYDRKEKYEDYEEKYDVVLKEKVRQKVIKERTVTDWQPYSGSLTTQKVVCVQLNDEHKDLNKHYTEKFMNDEKDIENDFEAMVSLIDFESNSIPFEDSDFQDMSYGTPDSTGIDMAIMRAKLKAERQINFPGDHVKDVSTNFTHRVIQTKYCIAPEYEWKFKVPNGEKQCSIKSFTTRCNPDGLIPTIESALDKVVSKRSKKFGIMSISMSMIAIVLAIIIPLMISKTIGGIISLLSMIISIVGYVIFKKKKKKTEKQVHQEVLDFKKERLEEFFKRNNMPPLTPEELKGFNLEKE